MLPLGTRGALLTVRSASRHAGAARSYAWTSSCGVPVRAGLVLAQSRCFSSSFTRLAEKTGWPNQGTRPDAQSQEQHHPPTLRNVAWSLIIKLACTAPVALFVVYHVVSLAQVQGGSMRPTFNTEVTELGTKHAGDIVVLNKWTPGMRKYTVGDIVTLTDPDNPDLELTKRILALEDDVVAVHGMGLHSDQRILAAVQDYKEGSDKSTGYIRVPPGHAWVEGDASLLDLNKAGPAQRDQSRDSREFGPVPLGLVNARIDWILWPPRRFGRPAKRPGMKMPQIPDSVEYGPSSPTQRTRQDLVGRRQTQLLEARNRERAEDKALGILNSWR